MLYLGVNKLIEIKRVFGGGLVVLFSLFLFSCEKSTDVAEITELRLTITKLKILDNNSDAATVFVYNQEDEDVTGMVELYLDGIVLTSPEIRSSQAGEYDLYAKYGDIASNVVMFEVVEDSGLEYTKNILIEQFTGTWCGYCPRAVAFIHNLMATDNDIGHIAYHLNDPLSYAYNVTLFQYFGFTGVPTVLADRNIVWNGSASQVSALHKPVRAGISLAVSGSEAQLNINVGVRFGIRYTDNIKLTVYLVEDNLVEDQENYYNDDPSSVYYQAGSVMTDFVHRNTMKMTLTDMFGDNIPSGSVDIGGLYEVSFHPRSIPVTNIDNVKVVAFVSYGSGSKKDQVINSLVCSFNSESGSTLVGSR